MKANVVHASLNARGGGERLAVATIRALANMGIDVELITIEKPDMAAIELAYGIGLDGAVKKIKTLNIFPTNSVLRGYTINTHGDVVPFFRQSLSKKNAITYCHYPIAGQMIDCGDSDYSDFLQNLRLSGMAPAMHNAYFKHARKAYDEMLRNTMLLTNSEFSRRAILELHGVQSTILYPPVDVDTFRKVSLSSESKDDSILVISRFHPSKKIENAIHLAGLLKQKFIGTQMNIVGSISPGSFGYLKYLKSLVMHYGIEDFVKFQINATFSRLLELMRSSKVYFHPMPSEPFGISTVEAMSAGLIPVVPNIGGHTEFVPAKYQFSTLREAAAVVAKALDAPASERLMVSHSVQKFSTANYIKKFQEIVAEVFDIGKKPVEQTPIIPNSKKHQESISA